MPEIVMQVLQLMHVLLASKLKGVSFFAVPAGQICFGKDLFLQEDPPPPPGSKPKAPISRDCGHTRWGCNLGTWAITWVPNSVVVVDCCCLVC